MNILLLNPISGLTRPYKYSGYATGYDMIHQPTIKIFLQEVEGI